MTAVGLIGYGGIARDMIAALSSNSDGESVQIVGALARPGATDKARANLGDIEIVESLDALLSSDPDVVAEAPGTWRRERAPAHLGRSPHAGCAT